VAVVAPPPGMGHRGTRPDSESSSRAAGPCAASARWAGARAPALDGVGVGRAVPGRRPAGRRPRRRRQPQWATLGCAGRAGRRAPSAGNGTARRCATGRPPGVRLEVSRNSVVPGSCRATGSPQARAWRPRRGLVQSSRSAVFGVGGRVVSLLGTPVTPAPGPPRWRRRGRGPAAARSPSSRAGLPAGRHLDLPGPWRAAAAASGAVISAQGRPRAGDAAPAGRCRRRGNRPPPGASAATRTARWRSAAPDRDHSTSASVPSSAARPLDRGEGAWPLTRPAQRSVPFPVPCGHRLDARMPADPTRPVGLTSASGPFPRPAPRRW
jgi:hypothetical protein